MKTEAASRGPRTATDSRLARSVMAHPLRAFVAGAYAFSWIWWLAALAGLGMPAVVVGGFGPAIAAWYVTRLSGGSVREWARQIVKWRVRPRFYLYALGLPVLLWFAMNVVLASMGRPIDLSLLADRVPAYLGTFAFVAVLGGGFEEPGWRGFALPRLQARHATPIRATLLLALIWGLWHLPLYGLGFVGPMLYVFFYTYLYNRTGSVLLCIVLHAGFTAALDNLILTSDSIAVDLTILGTLVAGTLALIALTRGRLGAEPASAPIT